MPKVALTEIQEACEVFAKFPQLYVVEVWVPYSNCPSNNNTLSCMERVWATKEIRELNLPMCQIQHVETGKGIAGLALASENKSCFCRNLCEFSIADQPFAHYAQLARLDVCFAMCLQSSHTGDLLYVLEFYVNQGPGEYDHLRSFLCLLLPIMKRKLRSFNVASGQQLGEKLVVEVIEFSEASELAFSELDQADVFPVTFKFVQYGQNHFKDKKVQFPPEVVESVSSVEQAERCSTSAANLKKKDAAKKSNGGRTKTRLNIEPEDLKPYFGQKLKNVAMALGVSKSTINRRCRDYNIKMWPWNENHKKNRSLFMRESAGDSQQNTCLSCFSNLPPLDVPLHQNLSHTNPKSSQLVIVQPKVDMVVIKAKYEDNTFKFQLYNTAGMEKLVEEVAMRLNLKTGSFKLKYLDEDNDKILLACDADLQLCLKSLAAMSKTCIEVFVQSI